MIVEATFPQVLQIRPGIRLARNRVGFYFRLPRDRYLRIAPRLCWLLFSSESGITRDPGIDIGMDAARNCGRNQMAAYLHVAVKGLSFWRRKRVSGRHACSIEHRHNETECKLRFPHRDVYIYSLFLLAGFR